MHRCWRVITEKLLMPEAAQFRLFPGMPMGDEGTGYFRTKAEACRIMHLDWKAKGMPKLCMLRLWQRKGDPRWHYEEDKGWDWGEELRNLMNEAKMTVGDFAQRRKMHLTTAHRHVKGMENPPKIEKGRIRRMFTYLRQDRWDFVDYRI